jgi:hypothetical protein
MYLHMHAVDSAFLANCAAGAVQIARPDQAIVQDPLITII